VRRRLIPLLLEMMLWSAKYDPQTGAPAVLITEPRKDRTHVAQAIRGAGGIEHFLSVPVTRGVRP